MALLQPETEEKSRNQKKVGIWVSGSLYPVV
jgi:hypothetical protein